MSRLPEAWIAPPRVRELRELTRYRTLCHRHGSILPRPGSGWLGARQRLVRGHLLLDPCAGRLPGRPSIGADLGELGGVAWGSLARPTGWRRCRGARGCAEPFGCCSCGCGLGGAVLDVAEAGDGFGEGGEAEDERDRGRGAVVPERPRSGLIIRGLAFSPTQIILRPGRVDPRYSFASAEPRSRARPRRVLLIVG
jgi:hypothetical protein